MSLLRSACSPGRFLALLTLGYRAGGGSRSLSVSFNDRRSRRHEPGSILRRASVRLRTPARSGACMYRCAARGAAAARVRRLSLVGARAKPRRLATGRTGYPIVDAGMRELWATGWMHNRVRMIVAPFSSRTFSSTGARVNRGSGTPWSTPTSRTTSRAGSGWPAAVRTRRAIATSENGHATYVFDGAVAPGPRHVQ